MDPRCLEPERYLSEGVPVSNSGVAPAPRRNTGTLRVVVAVGTAAIISAAGILGYLSVDQSPTDGSAIAAVVTDTSSSTTTAATTSTSAITTLPASTSTAAAVTTTTVSPPTTARVVVTPSTANTPQLPANEIDFSSPLLFGYTELVQWVESYPEDLESIDADVNSLTSTTGFVWNQQMLFALSASYCSGWDRYFPDGGVGFTSTKGYQDWSSAIAPVLGISTTAARQALDSLRWQNYPYPCD